MNQLRLKIKCLDPITCVSLPILLLGIFLFGKIYVSVLKKDLLNMLVFISLFVILIFLFYKLIKHIDDNDDKYPGMLLKNNYDGDVKIRLKNGTIKCIKKTDKYPISINGINTFIKKDMIYKVNNSTNVKINNDGTISEYSLISKLINSWTNINNLPDDWKELNKTC